jgi:hypothetical protein
VVADVTTTAAVDAAAANGANGFALNQDVRERRQQQPAAAAVAPTTFVPQQTENQDTIEGRDPNPENAGAVGDASAAAAVVDGGDT